MTDPWLHILGVFAAFLGFATLEDARRGRRLRPLTFFWSGLALYLVYVNQLTPTLDSLDGETVAAVGLLFCAASPVIGWVWWGQHGRIRRRLLRFVGFVVLLAVSFVVWTLILGPVSEAAILAVLTAGLPFLPIRRTLRRWRSKMASRRHRRQQDRVAPDRVAGDERERKREQAELDRLRRRETELAREVESRDRQLARLARKEEKQAEGLERRRKEVLDQVRVLREAEVERIREGDAGLRFHPHYGFLMAEAWRVLRAQIAREERIPAAEHDSFFFQVVDELVAPHDFEERYFHRASRRAIATVNAYLDGNQPLDATRQKLKKLHLKPQHLAPEPLPEYSGASLMEAWIVPHRRFQALQWEDFQDGCHPYQEQILIFLRQQDSGLPDRRQWQQLWDAHPAVFSGTAAFNASRTSPPSTDSTQRRLWRRALSIWHSVRAR